MPTMSLEVDHGPCLTRAQSAASEGGRFSGAPTRCASAFVQLRDSWRGLSGWAFSSDSFWNLKAGVWWNWTHDIGDLIVILFGPWADHVFNWSWSSSNWNPFFVIFIRYPSWAWWDHSKAQLHRRFEVTLLWRKSPPGKKHDLLGWWSGSKAFG